MTAAHLTSAANPAEGCAEEEEVRIVDFVDFVDLANDVDPDCPDVTDLEQALCPLHAEAVTATRNAVNQAEQARLAELTEMGTRLRTEQDRLYQLVLQATPDAVRAAAQAGHRTAVVLRFAGPDKLGEFCYLYMLKGPGTPDGRAEMRDMGAKPLLQKLRAVFHAAGFGLYHAWQRATNENTLAVTW